MEAQEEVYDASPIWDTLDIDLVLKVLQHTAFSPFFIALVPTFYYFTGSDVHSNAIIYNIAWFVLVCGFWALQWLSTLYRNQGSLLLRPPRYDWGEQIIVVTGGASGIGELLANTLAVRNVTVVVLDVKPIVTENYNIQYYKCDVSKWEEVEAVAKTIVEEIGHPTVVINNAGVVQGKLITDLTPEDVRQTFDVNVLAHFWTLKAFLPEMIKQKVGHIVTIGSVMGLVGSAQMTDYSASKAALVSLNESLRYELDKRHKTPAIRTTLVLPGHVFTPLFSRMPALPNAWWFKFLAPSQPPYTIAKAVIAALDMQESRTVYLPFYTYVARWVWCLPSFGRDFFQWLSGADYAMEGFVKVSGRRADEGPVPPVVADKSKSQ